MNSFKEYYFGTLIHPSRTFAQLIVDDRKLKFGTAALGIAMFFYTMVYVHLTIAGGAPSVFTPWLSIPKEEYYFYNRFMLAPSMFLCWIVSAGVIQLLSKPFGGKGTFEEMLSTLGFAISISCMASLLHDFPDSFLGAVGVIDLTQYEIALNSPTIWRTILWTAYCLSFVLFILLFTKSTKTVQKIGRVSSFCIGLTGYVFYQVIFLIFNR